MTELFNISEKIILITGSSRGIGFSLATGFAKAEAIVVMNATSATSVGKPVEELKAKGYKVHAYPFDVTDQLQVEESIKQIEGNIGPIDVLVNNASIHRRFPLEEMPLEDWKKVLDVDLNSVFVVSQAVAKYMIPRREGRIINITSLNAEGARPTIANYCAAKGGPKMLTKSMATEWGRYNILTNAIGPGYFLTDLTQPLADDPQFDAWVKSEVPLQRWGNPDELIGAALFLASDAASYVNGHTLYVDGGWQACL